MSCGETIDLTDDQPEGPPKGPPSEAKGPQADPHSGDNLAAQGTLISRLFINSILTQTSKAQRYLDALDK